ncbi:hypothetical protein NEOLEDRAFT_1056442 [Neolentinus lepideus HHB14362 ss-1]|uniref:C2H2-type domain-containing protein n=1 Tax=Neolentinus lepideus HHB14362 ss-1 TaxID=1314782 RepID=A0A165V772_9AGAM|nr:hypothetical protein NEOLEDRAFT_1056442 [Neolentinus lepideus HHB14362 ss-1]
MPSRDEQLRRRDLSTLEKKSLVCGIDGCEKVFARAAEVQRHQRNVHLRIRPFKCKWDGCEARFSAKTSLHNHMNTHTGAKPHICGVSGCQSAFADQSSRSRHRIERHTICDIYTCDASGCGARYNAS